VRRELRVTEAIIPVMRRTFSRHCPLQCPTTRSDLAGSRSETDITPTQHSIHSSRLCNIRQSQSQTAQRNQKKWTLRCPKGRCPYCIPALFQRHVTWTISDLKVQEENLQKLNFM